MNISYSVPDPVPLNTSTHILKNRYNIMAPASCFLSMIRKYIFHRNRRIYAIYYRMSGTLYINLNFHGKLVLIILK